MKNLIFMSTFLFSTFVWAHCPYSVTEGSGDYCFDLEWMVGQQKVKKVFVDTSIQSPFLNTMSEVPAKWIYSQTRVRVWKKGDAQHIPVFLENFKIVPYMTMMGGHHHGAASQWNYDSTQGAYVLSGMAFQQMEGCWILNLQMGDQPEVTIKSISEFVNLNSEEQASAAALCTESGAPGEGSGHHH